jgi:hypothetical protein
MNIPYASSIYYPLNVCSWHPSDSFSIQQVWREHLIFLMFVSPFYCFSCTFQFTALYVPQPILLLCITFSSLGSTAGRLKYFGMLSCINLQHPRFESYCAAVCINICSEHIRLFFFYPTQSSTQPKLMSTPTPDAMLSYHFIYTTYVPFQIKSCSSTMVLNGAKTFASIGTLRVTKSQSGLTVYWQPCGV